MPEIKLKEYSGSSDPKVQRLRATNELWDEYSPLWKFYLSAYEGGESFANKDNLFKHQRENDADFADRCKRLHNLNYCESLVDYFTNFIFSESIDRNGGSNSDFYLKFIKDVNKKKESIDDFMRQVSDDSQVFGMSYILVDAPAKEAEIVTKQQEQEQGIRPYWVLIKPDEILDWVVDDFGVFQYVKRKQYVREAVGKSLLKLEKYTEFYPNEVVVSRLDVTNPVKVRFVDSKPYANELGKIPIVVARYRRSKHNPFIGLSFLRDFAYNNREIMNLTSLLQEFLYRQAFNILAKEVDTSVPLNDQQEGVFGTSNVLEYPQGAKAPTYLSPPADPARFIQDERARITKEMFIRAAQDTVNELFNGEKSSGFSQAQSFSKTVPFISSRADTLERVENELMSLTMEHIGKTWDGKIKYKDRYELTNLTDALTQLLTLVKDFQIPSETFVKAELKRMVREYDGKFPPETLSKIEKEIEDMNFKEWAGFQKKALIGRPQGTTSPGEQQKPKNTGTMLEAAAEAKVNTAATKDLKE